jgi:hypothetical protein
LSLGKIGTGGGQNCVIAFGQMPDYLVSVGNGCSFLQLSLADIIPCITEIIADCVMEKYPRIKFQFFLEGLTSTLALVGVEL